MLNRLKAHIKATIRKGRNAKQQPLPTTDVGVAVLIGLAIEACGLSASNDSLRNAVATTLLSLPQGSTSISVNQLRDVVNQARCKQAAYSIIEAIRTKDKESREKTNEGTDSSVGPQVS